VKRTYRIAAKVIASGIFGILLFIISIYLIGFIMPANDHPDVVDGWAAGFLMITGAACSMFLSGAIAMMLSYKDISSALETISIPVFSGLITAIIPFLIIVLLGTYEIGLFYLGLMVIFICLLISLFGGLFTYIIIKLMGKLRHKSI
jgi:hypothetical protein